MRLLNVAGIGEAREILLDCVKGWDYPVERIGILEACGRVLAEDVKAPQDIPAFRRSTVDGFAVLSKDTAAADDTIPVFLTLAGAVEMGKAADMRISSGQCAYVPTGGMIPEGADAMVMVEYSERFGENSVAIYAGVPAGQGVTQIGEDVGEGAVILKRGQKLRPQDIGALAVSGKMEATVYAPLPMTLISTGDELVTPDTVPAPGEVRDINTYALAALAVQAGYKIEAAHVLRDAESLLEDTVRGAMAHSRVVAVSGGSSQGEKDFTKDVIDRLSEPGVLVHGMAISPGKPTIIGYDAKSETLLIGLPGHPVSAVMVFKMLLSWLTDTLTGRTPPPPVPAKISCNLAGSPGRTTCLSVSLSHDGSRYIAEPVFGKSGLITTLTKADGYVVIDRNKEGLNKGEDVLVHLT